MGLSFTRNFPPNLIGTNFAPFDGKLPNEVPAFMDEGYTMFTPGKVEKTGVTGTDGSNQITVTNNAGIVANQYVTGVGVPAVSQTLSNGQPVLTKVTDVNGNLITLNANINTTLTNATITFHPVHTSLEYQIALMAASGVEIVRFALQWNLFEKTRGSIDWQNGNSSLLNNDPNQWNLDKLIYLLSKNGIEAMPRFGSPPPWALDYDYRFSSSNLFQTQDPSSDSALSKVGIRLTATGTSGNNYITTTNMKRGFMIIQGMVITGSGIPSNTKVTSVIKNSSNYRINLSANLTANLTGTNNITAGIQNYATNNPTENINNLVFDTVQDFNIFLTHLQRKGGSPPKDYDEAARFMNKAADRYGNDGTFWTDLSMWPTGSSITRTASGTAGTDTTSATYSQKITISSSADLVTGMYIEDTITNTNGNNSYIQPNTKIIAIDGTTLVLSKPLLQNMPAGTTVVAKYPRVTYWQVGNEMNDATSESMDITALIKSTPSGTNQVVKLPTSKYKWIARGKNWPQHIRNQKWLVDAIGGEYIFTDVVLNDEQYSFAPSFLEMVAKIKKEVHAVDPKAQIVLGAVAVGPTNNNRDPQYESNINNIETMNGFQLIFDPRIGNGQNKFDILSINVYTSPTNTISYLQNNILPFIKKYFYPDNSTTQIQPSVLPKVMISEYGWSTAPGVIDGGVTETEQNNNVSYIIRYSTTTTVKNLGDFVENEDPWTYVAVMYYRWASNQTVPAVAGKENWRGLYKYDTVNNTFTPKLAAKSFAEQSIQYQGRR